MFANGDQVLRQEEPQARDKHRGIKLLYIGCHVHVMCAVAESLVTKVEGNLRLFRVRETSRQILKNRCAARMSWTARIAELLIVFTLDNGQLKNGYKANPSRALSTWFGDDGLLNEGC